MEQNNKNEMSVDQTTTSHNSNAEVTDVNSVPPTDDNYTTDNTNIQVNLNRNYKLPNFFDSRGHFKHNVFTKFAKIKRINGTNHIYRGSSTGIYVRDDDLIKFTLQTFVPKFKLSQIREEVERLNIATKLSEVTESSPNYIGFANGIYNLDTSEFQEYSSCNSEEIILINKLNIDYTEQVPKSNDIVDNLISSITDNSLFMYELIGVCLSRISIPMAFVLTGTNSTNGIDGRDILLDIIRAIAGECASSETLQELITSKTFHSLYAKTCNISNEQTPTKMANINQLIKLIRNDKVLPTKEYGGLTFVPYTTLIFNVRDILDFDKVFSDLEGYFKVIPFDKQLSIDKSFIDSIFTPENLLYITIKSLNALVGVLQRGNFSIPETVEIATSKYLLNNNSAKEFCLENPIFYIERKANYYDKYDRWCRENNKIPMINSQFGKEVLKLGYLPARYSVSAKKRPCYYTVKDFDYDKLFNEYADIIEAKSIDAVSNKGTYSRGNFIEAFIDFFHSNTIEDMNHKSITELKDVGEKIDETLRNMPNTM